MNLIRINRRYNPFYHLRRITKEKTLPKKPAIQKQKTNQPLITKISKKKVRLLPHLPKASIKLNSKTNPFLPSIEDCQTLSNYYIQNKALYCSFEKDDTCKKYRIESIHITAHKLYATTEQNHTLDWDIILSSQCRLLLVSKKKIPYHPSLEIPFIHDLAQQRSDFFAQLSSELIRKSKQTTYAVTLDGTYRNINSLLKYNIPCANIIHMEKNRKCALFQKLLSSRKERDVHTLYMGSELRHSLYGMESYIIKNKFKDTYLGEDTRNNIIALYFDSCGDVIPTMNEMLSTLPRLQFFGITQAKRNTSQNRLDEFVPLNGFKLIKKFDQPKVRCHFYLKM